MPVEVGTLSAKLRLDDAQFNQRMGRAEKSVGGLSHALGAIGVGAAIYAMGRFAQSALSAASQVEENLNVLNVAFKENAAGVRVWAAEFGGAAQRSSRQMEVFAGSMGAMLSGMLSDTTSVTAMSTSLAALAVDLGSFFNVIDDEAILALRSGLAGEAEPMKKFGVVMTEAALNAFALGKGIGLTTQKMDAQSKILLRYLFILEQTSQAQGDAEKTAGSYANQVKGAGAQLDNLTTNLGKGLLPLASDLLVVFVQWGAALAYVGQEFAALRSEGLRLSTMLQGVGAGWVASVAEGVGATGAGRDIRASQEHRERIDRLNATDPIKLSDQFYEGESTRAVSADRAVAEQKRAMDALTKSLAAVSSGGAGGGQYRKDLMAARAAGPGAVGFEETASFAMGEAQARQAAEGLAAGFGPALHDTAIEALRLRDALAATAAEDVRWSQVLVDSDQELAARQWEAAELSAAIADENWAASVTAQESANNLAVALNLLGANAGSVAKILEGTSVADFGIGGDVQSMVAQGVIELLARTEEGQEITSALTTILDNIASAAAVLLRPFLGLFEGLVAFSSLLMPLVEVLAAFQQSELVTLVVEGIRFMAAVLGGIVSVITDGLKTVYNWIIDALAWVVEIFSDDWAASVRTWKMDLSEGAQSGDGFWDSMQGSFMQGFDTVWEPATEAVDGLGIAADRAAGALLNLPAGYRTEAARYAATEADARDVGPVVVGASAAAAGGGGGSGTGGLTQTIRDSSFNFYSVDDVRAFWEELQRVMRAEELAETG